MAGTAAAVVAIEARCIAMPPLLAPDGRVLVLGSMPGAASLAAQQYYPYPRRVAMLAGAGVSVWDVLHSCTRPGSLDSAIGDEVAHDFAAFLAEQPQITHIFFNGAKAEQAFRRHALGTLGAAVPHLHRLPSTSPAHAAKGFAEKLNEWWAVGAAAV
jgi:TDG/mug DNA glycosylase family protein